MGSSVYRKPHNNFQQASEAKCLLCPAVSLREIRQPLSRRDIWPLIMFDAQ